MLFPQLAENNCRPMGTTSSPGLQARIDVNPKPTNCAETLRYEEQSLARRRNTEVDKQRGSNESAPLYKPVSQPDIPGSQERWVIQTSDKPETSELAHRAGAFQDGEPGNDEGPVETRRLDGVSGLKRCLSISGNLGGPPETPEISVAREHIRVPMSTLWLEQRPMCLHQTAEAGTCKTTPSRSPPSNVPGRHAGDVTVQGGAGETNCSDNITPGITGICSQQRQVPATTSSDHTVSWLSSELQRDEDQANRGENCTDHNSLQKGQREGITVSKRVSQADRQDDSNSASCPPSSIVVPRAPMLEESNAAEISLIRDISEADPRSPSRIRLVGNQEEFDDREGHDDQGARPNYGDGCFTDGMGSSLQKHKDRRHVVPVGEQEPHQLSRTPGSYVCSEVICQGQEGQPHSSQNRQQNRSILCQPHGGHTISCAEQACNPTVAMVSREKHSTHYRTSTRDGQLHSGRRVQNNPVIGRMAATSGSIQADSGDSGQMQHRSVCNMTQCPTGAVCQLETRPQCSRDGCTTTSLGQMGRLCIPSLLPNRKMPQEEPRRQSIPDFTWHRCGGHSRGTQHC